jgi:hypothetical protein
LTRFLFFSCIFLIAALNSFSQTVLDKPLQKLVPQPLPVLLKEIEIKSPLKFFYLDDWLNQFQVDERMNGHSLRGMLDELLKGSDVSYVFMFGYAVIFTKDPAAADKREALINTAIVQRRLVQTIQIGDRKDFNARQKVTLSGLTSGDDEKLLSGVVISLDNNVTVESDLNGKYRLSLSPGEYILNFHYPPYEDQVADLAIYRDGTLDINLQQTPVMLEEVVISDQLTLDKSIGQTNLSMSQIKRAPVFLGEVDLIKQVQTQAGVTTVGEGAAGFNVRGGGIDQNLVLYDDVPIFNTSHALGFFTAFNPDAIGEVSFYRGGIPSAYGGRVSSVLNIVSREGDYKKWKGSGGIGLISSHFSIGGPLKKDTSSLIISLRSSYSNWMLHAIQSNYEDLKNTSVSFYDGSVKYTHKLNERNKITLSGYKSMDQFSLADDTTFYWRNVAASVRFDHSFTQNFFGSAVLSYGRYEFSLGEEHVLTAFDFSSAITYPSLKIDFQSEGNQKLLFGLQSTFYEFEPGAMKPTSVQSNARRFQMPSETSIENAAYVSDAFFVTDKIFIEAGFRYSIFNRLGGETVYHYQPDLPRELRNVDDSTVYSNGEISKTYHGLEPRLSIRYNIDEYTAVKAGYNRLYQYMHLITNTAAVTPADIWQSANTYFQPQIADQISLGVYRNISDNMFETFLEMYVKQVKNILDFKDGANLILNPHLETALVPAVGTSYGVEVSVTKVKGRLTGSANYAYSRSLRKTKSIFESEKINHGGQYPSNYDQPHVVNVNWRYGVSRRLFFSGNFAYRSGRPVSLPTGAYVLDGVPVSNFSNRNQYRIPDYHRLDLAFIIEGNHKRKKFWDGNWIFSFYNVYARRNAYSVFFMDNGEGLLKPYKLSVVGTIIPSLSYNFKF